jgi:K+-transporting ATPase ATPase C chain
MTDLLRAAGVLALLTLVLGVAYPLAITGVNQVAFGEQADGDPSLIARPFVVDTGRTDSDGTPITRPDPRYFQPRPSATGYSTTATFFANRGPNQASARSFYRGQVAAYLALERPTSPGLTVKDVPIDAVTTSASGVDPHISPDNAAIQARRVAAVRKLDPRRVARLVDGHTDGRALGVFGEPGVNVGELNAALDAEASA